MGPVVLSSPKCSKLTAFQSKIKRHYFIIFCLHYFCLYSTDIYGAPTTEPGIVLSAIRHPAEAGSTFKVPTATLGR